MGTELLYRFAISCKSHTADINVQVPARFSNDELLPNRAGSGVRHVLITDSKQIKS